jgi:SAM-dependent methyltransferase
MLCKVCGSERASVVGEIEYYTGFKYEVYDCQSCKSRFTRQYDEIYNKLHGSLSSCYGMQKEIASRAKKFFDAKDLPGLRAELSTRSSYKFVIDEIEKMVSKRIRILECGCSRGYLASYFILSGYDIIGIDISETAIRAAVADFGPFFFHSSCGTIADRGPFDVIYHIGTIGCVADPIGLTNELLSLLRVGGKLVFNAPNKEGCWQKRQLWIDFAPPPDLTTLYEVGFWTRRFSRFAYVTEHVETCSPEWSFVIFLRRLFRNWRPPTPSSIDSSLERYTQGRIHDPTRADRFWNIVERFAVGLVRRLGIISLFPRKPTPFGIFVSLIKQQT